MEIVNERSTNLAEVKESLEKTKKQTGELNFRAEKTLEYVKNVMQLDKKKADELKAELEKLNISRLKEANVQKIIDTVPKTAEDVKIITQAFSVSLSQDSLKKIADAVKTHT